MVSLLEKALKHQTIDRPPVWLMRQAGRYLTEYRVLKERYGFMGLCTTPELATEITLQPIRAFEPDAAIIFSDILIPVLALGFELSFAPAPKIHNPISSPASIRKIQPCGSLQDLSFVFSAIRQARSELDKLPGEKKALIGFAGAPWTVASYLIEQGIQKNFNAIQIFAAQEPKAVCQLLDILTELTTDYLTAQIESGADVIQLFDSWAGNLSAEDYQIYALPYVQRIFSKLKERTNCPLILYINNSSHLLHLCKLSGADCLSIDWRITLSDAEKIVGSDLALQGNLNSTYLFTDSDTVQERTRTMINELTRRTGYVANLGHGVLPETPREAVLTFIKTVKQGWKSDA